MLRGWRRDRPMSDPRTGPDFEELKRRLQSSDAAERRRALDQLIARYMPQVLRHAHRVFFDQLRPAQDSEDVTQSVLVKFAERLRTGKIALRTERELLALLKQMTEQKL